MKRSKRFRLLWAALLLLPVISEARVDKLYQQHCAACHGGKGEGGLGGSLVDGVYQHRATETAWGDVIRDGLPDLGMQGFSDQLNDEQIRSLVVYLTELESRANRVPRSAIADGVIHTERLSYRLEEVVKNPKRMWGSRFFLRGSRSSPKLTERSVWSRRRGRSLPRFNKPLRSCAEVRVACWISRFILTMRIMAGSM